MYFWIYGVVALVTAMRLVRTMTRVIAHKWFEQNFIDASDRGLGFLLAMVIGLVWPSYYAIRLWVYLDIPKTWLGRSLSWLFPEEVRLETRAEARQRKATALQAEIAEMRGN